MTDITEHPAGGGKLYLCAVKDVFFNRIFGYSVANGLTSELAVAALRMATQRRNPDGTIVQLRPRQSLLLEQIPGSA